MNLIYNAVVKISMFCWLRLVRKHLSYTTSSHQVTTRLSFTSQLHFHISAVLTRIRLEFIIIKAGVPGPIGDSKAYHVIRIIGLYIVAFLRLRLASFDISSDFLIIVKSCYNFFSNKLMNVTMVRRTHFGVK